MLGEQDVVGDTFWNVIAPKQKLKLVLMEDISLCFINVYGNNYYVLTQLFIMKTINFVSIEELHISARSGKSAGL
jgi:hypothetical protein